ncbi:MAG: hypothetical protein WC694_03510 [Candidatus Paceibacterota bacterium]|jgi:hypothetical protein
MTITCTNEKCSKKFEVDNTDLEIIPSPSGNHSTQYLASGTIYCPSCTHEMEIEYLFDEVNDTGEILSEELSSLT